MDWATMHRRAAFSATLVLSAGAGFIACQSTVNNLWGQPQRSSANAIARPDIRSPGPQSPVRVVGGSIKLKATDGWTKMPSCAGFGNNFTSCIVSKAVKTSSLTLVGVNVVPLTTTWMTVGATGLGVNWTVTAYARGTNNTKGIVICVSDGKNCGASATKPTLIAIGAFDPTNMATLANESVETSDPTLWGYHDPNFASSSGASPGTATTLLEYMGKITVTIDAISTDYNCIEGLCQIYIGD
jgi:hypothetical protein